MVVCGAVCAAIWIHIGVPVVALLQTTKKRFAVTSVLTVWGVDERSINSTTSANGRYHDSDLDIGGNVRYALKTTADRYGEYREGKQVRAEIIAGTLIQEQLPGMKGKLRDLHYRGIDDGIREERATSRGMSVRKGPRSQ